MSVGKRVRDSVDGDSRKKRSVDTDETTIKAVLDSIVNRVVAAMEENREPLRVKHNGKFFRVRSTTINDKSSFDIELEDGTEKKKVSRGQLTRFPANKLPTATQILQACGVRPPELHPTQQSMFNAADKSGHRSTADFNV